MNKQPRFWTKVLRGGLLHKCSDQREFWYQQPWITAASIWRIAEHGISHGTTITCLDQSSNGRCAVIEAQKSLKCWGLKAWHWSWDPWPPHLQTSRPSSPFQDSLSNIPFDDIKHIHWSASLTFWYRVQGSLLPFVNQLGLVGWRSTIFKLITVGWCL